MFESSRQVYIYSNRYGMYIASGIVADLEKNLSEEIKNMEVKTHTECYTNNIVTLFID